MFTQNSTSSEAVRTETSAVRVLTAEEMLLISGGESYGEYSSTNNDYGISSGPTTEISGAVGTGIAAAGAVVPGLVGKGMTVAGGVIDVLSAVGYTTPQSVVNAGFIEYGMSVAESYGGQYGGSTFGNDFGDPNGPGSNSNVA